MMHSSLLEPLKGKDRYLVSMWSMERVAFEGPTVRKKATAQPPVKTSGLTVLLELQYME